VLLALAHVIAASKTTTTAKDFAAGDFMCAPSFLCAQDAGGLPGEAVMWVTESTFQPKRIAGDKKIPSSANSPVDRTGATKPDQ
jgi:hypothetical protein